MVHYIFLRRFCYKGKTWQTISYQINPENVNGKQRNSEAKKWCEEDDQYFTQVAGKNINNELFNVLINPPAFTNGFHDSGKIIIEQNHVRCFFRYVGARYAHSNTDVGLL